MKYIKKNIANRIGSAYLAVEGASRNEKIREKLKDYGYGKRKLDKGKQKVARAQMANEKRIMKRGEKIVATGNLKKILAQAKEMYIGFRKLARLALKKYAGLLKALGLDKASARTLAGWLDEARQFYSNALGSGEVMEKLSKFAVTPEKLEEGRGLLDKVKKAEEAQKKAKGDAVAATVELREAMADMDDWAGDFFQVARIAMKGSQLLEAMGIKAPSQSPK